MKNIISVMLIFAMLASVLSVGAFAVDAGLVDEINTELVKLDDVIADFFAPIADQFNCGSDDFMFEAGFNDFFGGIDNVVEAIVNGIIKLVADVEALFTK